MEMHRGHYWVKVGEIKRWRVAMVEWNGERKELTVFKEEKYWLDELENEDIEFRNILNPSTIDTFKSEKYNNNIAAKNRTKMEEPRPLFFIVQPKQHINQLRYVAYDNIQDVMEKAITYSKKQNNKNVEYLVYEAKPLGKMVNGQQKEIK